VICSVHYQVIGSVHYQKIARPFPSTQGEAELSKFGPTQVFTVDVLLCNAYGRFSEFACRLWGLHGRRVRQAPSWV